MKKSFGEFLKEKRQEKGLTQKQLATEVFVSESAISKWEKGVAYPDITLLPKLAEILGVTEHELITASIDVKSREEKAQAKKWRAFSMSWSMFFYISYVVALIPCFICNLAISKTLSWFWIVLSALILAFTFTNLPKLIKKHKLFLVPLSMFLALCLLLGVCCLYSGGNWFFVSTLSVFLGLVIIFMPIYIARYEIFSKIRKYNDFVSVGIDFIVLNVLLIVINLFTLINNYSSVFWYFSVALPIVLVIYLILNIFLSVRFLKVNKLIKTSIVLFLINILYLIPALIKLKNSEHFNIFKADLSVWRVDTTLEQNIHLIVFLSILFVGLVFLVCGLLRAKVLKKRKSGKI